MVFLPSPLVSTLCNLIAFSLIKSDRYDSGYLLYTIGGVGLDMVTSLLVADISPLAWRCAIPNSLGEFVYLP